MKKIIENIIKGILLWFTAITSLVWLCGVVSLIETGKPGVAILWFISDILLIYICNETITWREFYILSGTKHIRKFLKD